ncbi:unnamed protein product [Closterium sp. NIES-65]|nr:unnamed protein product [Closterium sp. NIES-65]
MCEAGAGTLLESLALKGADIPPQSDQHGGDESDSEGGVEEIKEPTIQDLAAEQLSHATQLKGLHEDMESLKDSVYSGEKGLDKVMGILSSLFTAVQGMAAKTGFKLPTGLVEVLNSDEPTTSTAAAPPPHRTLAASLEAPVNMIAVPHASTTAPSHARPTFCATTPCTVQGQGATPGAHKSEAGHSALAAVPSSTTQGQPVLQQVLLQRQVAWQGTVKVLNELQRRRQVHLMLLFHLLGGRQVPPPVLRHKGLDSQVQHRVCQERHQVCEVHFMQQAVFLPYRLVRQGVRAPSAVGFAQNAGTIQQVATSSAAHSWPIGFAHQPPSAVYPGTVQPSDLLQLPFSTLRPPLHPSAPFLAADEVLDDTNSQPGHTTAAQGRGLSSMLPGLMQGSQHVLPSPAASSSMAPATQGGEIGEVPGKRGWTGVTKKLDKDEWIARIVLDRASQSLIVINSHFGTEEEAARSIAAASHVMFVDKPTRGELILLTAADKAKLSDCSAHQCEVMVRMKFWHMWEEWRKYWPAAKAKWDEKTRRDEKKRAAINASLEEADARADKIARMRAGGNSGHAYASHEEGSGSKDG